MSTPCKITSDCTYLNKSAFGQFFKHSDLKPKESLITFNSKFVTELSFN